MSDITNADRAEWAQTALDAFRSIPDVTEGITAQDVGDLVTDLLHLVRREDCVDQFDAENFALAAARRHDEEAAQDKEE